MSSIVKMSIDYFADPDRGRPIANGNIYVGIVDKDPEVVAFQKQISVIQEDGSTVEVSQPLNTSKGGVPVYNGSPVTIVVEGDYSLKVTDKHDDQVYYIPQSSALAGQDVVATIDTIQELRDSDLNSLVSAVRVLGYTAKGDGGGGSLRIWTTGGSLGTYVDNGSSIIVPTGGDGSEAWLTPEDYPLSVREGGVVGDGSDESVLLAALDSSVTGVFIDLEGLTILTDTLPTNNFYHNGFIEHSFDDYIYTANELFKHKIANTTILMGEGAGALMPKWVKYKGTLKAYNIEAIGEGSLSKNIDGRNNTAIAKNALFNMEHGRYNIAIGLESQFSCNSDDGAIIRGTRNTSIGSNSARFNVVGYSNCSMGRNAAQSVTDVNFIVAIGAASMSGYAPLGLDNETIENQTPITNGSQTFIGTNAGYESNNEGNAGYGTDCAMHVNISSVVAMGFEAAKNIDVDSFIDGRQKIVVSLSGTYSWVINTISCVVSLHGFTTGNLILASLDGEEANYLAVTVTDPSNFVITTPYTDNKTGTIAITEHIANNVLTPSTGVTAFGRKALKNAKNCHNNVAVGEVVLIVSEGLNNTGIGGLSLTENTLGFQNTGAGYSALRKNTIGNHNTAVGEFAASNTTASDYITAIGKSALRLNVAGGIMDGFSNVSGLGYDCRVSGSNQVQLGDSATTTYAFGAIQDRSDERDKADVAEIPSEYIDFILSIDWKIYKWDYRDDYIIISDDGKTIYQDKDGSKKRTRFHTGCIAQEIKTKADKAGIDFGGYQDHSLLESGSDVKTIGYQEFIPILGQLCQKQQATIDSLIERIEALESKI